MGKRQSKFFHDQSDHSGTCSSSSSYSSSCSCCSSSTLSLSSGDLKPDDNEENLIVSGPLSEAEKLQLDSLPDLKFRKKCSKKRERKNKTDLSDDVNNNDNGNNNNNNNKSQTNKYPDFNIINYISNRKSKDGFEYIYPIDDREVA